MIPALLLAAAFTVSVSAEKPRDFDKFWAKTRHELSAIPLEPTLEPDAARSDAAVTCFKASYRSLGRVLVHARYCRPARAGKFPGVLISPWYGQGAVDAPKDFADRGLAVLWFQARGFDVDQSTYPLANSWYVLDGIDSPRTFVYRFIVSHALRGLDFLAARPEVDASRLAAMGASQGGGLTLLVAGLDSRVSVAAADFPFLTDWENSMKDAGPPYADVRGWIDDHPKRREEILHTLSYFDTTSAADRVGAPVLVQVGLRDKTCSPAPIMAMFEKIKSGDKSLVRFDADHPEKNAARWKGLEEFISWRLLGR